MGLPDGDAEQYPSPRQRPWPSFALAAQAAVQHLEARFGLDLWLVTHVTDVRQTVVASAGPWSAVAAPGAYFSWRDSFCVAMLEQRGPTWAPDVSAIPAYADAATGVLAQVRAYVGVPLEGDDEEFFGTLCAYAGGAQHQAPADLLGTVELVGQMLSTILAREQVAARRTHEAAAASALTDRDHSTGLLNERGWRAALRLEDQRVQRYGSSTGTLIARIERPQENDATAAQPLMDLVVRRCAEVLATNLRPGDVSARLEDDEFAVLAIECDAHSLRAMKTKLRIAWRTAGLNVALGTANRRAGESLAETSLRARAAMTADSRRRHEPRH